MFELGGDRTCGGLEQHLCRRGDIQRGGMHDHIFELDAEALEQS